MQISKISQLSNKRISNILNFKNNLLNTQNQLKLQPQAQLQQETTANPNLKPKLNLKKLLFDAAIVFALTTLIINLIKGKNKTASGVKTFIDKNENKIKNIKLEKGKAILPDGSGFSGTMETINKQGDKFKFFYEKGNLTDSYKNDCVFKTYRKPLIIPQDVDSSIKITEYSQSKDKKNVFEIMHSNTKLKRFEKKGSYTLGFDNQGRIKTKDVFDNDFKKSYSFVSYKESDKSLNARDVEKKARKINIFDKNNNCIKKYLKKDDEIFIKDTKTNTFTTISFSNTETGLNIKNISVDETAKKKTYTVFEDSKIKKMSGKDEYNLTLSPNQDNDNNSLIKKITEEINFAQENKIFENFSGNEFSKAVVDFLKNCAQA